MIVAYLPQHLLATDGATVMEETSKALVKFGMKAEIDEINAINDSPIMKVMPT
jgi:ATP-binding cassette subfamily F protein 3